MASTFLVPSILGILLFMIPMKYEGIGKYRLRNLQILLSGAIAPIMPWTATITLIIAALGSVIVFSCSKRQVKPSFITNLFKVSLFWTIVRIIGASFSYYLSYFKWDRKRFGMKIQVGCYLSETGLVTFLFTIFLFAGYYCHFF